MAIEIPSKTPPQVKTTSTSLLSGFGFEIDVGKLLDAKPDTQDRIFFTEQLALLLETGTPLHTALNSMIALAPKPSIARILQALRDDVEQGTSFAAALEKHPDFYTKAYVNLIAAAESGGFLDKVLNELKDTDAKMVKLRARVTSALIYPVFLLLFSIAVVIFVLTVVFPKFADLFAKISDDLPGSTKVLMMASNGLINHWLAISVSLLVAAAAFIYWIKTERGQHILDGLKLKTIVIKEVFIQMYLVQTLRLMGLSLANGVTVMDTLDACKEVVHNRLFNQFIMGIQDKVKDGAGFAAGFAEQDFIPSTVKQMISTGDDSGNLHHVMIRIADHYETELQKKLDVFTRLAEPVMLLIMGSVVGIIVSSLILPIFKLSKAVG